MLRTALALTLSTFLAAGLAAAERELLNVSYDLSRDIYAKINPLFTAHVQAASGAVVRVKQSHDGSTKQARSVIEGLAADVVSMNSASDIDMISELSKGALVPADWASRLPHGSAPSASTHLIVVREGNPKGIRDWGDLATEGIKVVMVNPKTGGNGRYAYLALWTWAARQPGATPESIEGFVGKVLRNVVTFEKGGKAASTTFAQRGIGDALLTFESEAVMLGQVFNARFDTVVPSVSVRADNPVAVVVGTTAKGGAEQTALAESYLRFLYTPQAQQVFADSHLRPVDPAVLAANTARFPAIPLVTIEELGGWKPLIETHFKDGGRFDQLVKKP
jgi:sulfate transport system substrate-binding protein